MGTLAIRVVESTAREIFALTAPLGGDEGALLRAVDLPGAPCFAWSKAEVLYQPLGGVVILGRSAVAVSAPADTNEDTLATVIVPAKAMGPSGTLRVSTAWTVTNSANSKTLNVKFGGTAFMSTAQTAIVSYQGFAHLQNRGLTNSQISGGPASGATGSGIGAVPAMVIDTTADVPLLITGQKASAGETLTLERYLVELIRGA